MHLCGPLWISNLLLSNHGNRIDLVIVLGGMLGAPVPECSKDDLWFG
jgi:hypothetical protein